VSRSPTRLIPGALALCLLATGLFAAGASAQQADEPPFVPDKLKPWVGWVLHGAPDDRCTGTAGGDRVCGWPGRMTLQLEPDGATFSVDVWLDVPTTVALPGSKAHWPQAVLVDGAPAAVIDDGERAQLRLDAGHHRVGGKLQWERPPEVLTVPASIGVIAVQRPGKEATTPRREGDRIWLSGGERKADVSDALRIEVHRRLSDGVPLRVQTRLELKVTGKARDVLLGDVLVKGTRPTAVESGLPIQVGADGATRVHVRAGSHVVTIMAVHPGDPKTLQVPARMADAAPQEVWVWRPDAAVRAVKVSGLTEVDPERTSLPESWRGGTTMLAVAGRALTLETTRRGQPESAPNDLRLRREIWLDLSGDGFTVRDHITGTMHRDWRLNYGGTGTLGRVAQRGKDVLITTDKSGKPGVELRNGKLDLRAELRLARDGGGLPAVGWDLDARSLSATLHLPPGWKLLGAEGVDRAPGTWISSWTLFDFFLLLMVAFGTAKLLGWRWGAVALLALAISHGESEAPRWIWLHLLAAIALCRVLPPGFVRKLAWIYRGGALLWLLLMLVPFSIHQVRHGIYPQVRTDAWSLPGTFADGAKNADLAVAELDVRAYEQKAEMPKEAPSAPSSGLLARGRRSKGDKSGYYGKKKKKVWAQQQRALQQVDPNAIVQTGPGLPDWKWSTRRLSWSGPVSRDQELKLHLLGQGLNLLLALLRVALMLGLAVAALRWRELRDMARSWQDPGPGTADAAAPLVAAILGCGLLLAPTPARAGLPQQVNNQLNAELNIANLQGDRPGPAVLQTLRKRLLAHRACRGRCATASTMHLQLQGDALHIRAEVHAERLAAWTLPGPLSAVRITSVTVDDAPTTQLRRTAADMLQVRVPAGRHIIRATATLPPRDVVTLNFAAGALPRRVTTETSAWRIDGIGPAGVPDPTLQLARKERARHRAGGRNLPGAATATVSGDAEVPPWYTVERALVLGLPWTVRTTITRADATRPGLLKLPLLPGEAVLSAGVRIQRPASGGAIAVVQLARGERTATVDSELSVGPALALVAPTGKPWTERWTLQCSPIFRCAPRGIVPVSRENAAAEQVFAWQPWPGERIDIAVTRPKGAKGQAVTVDKVRYRVSPGQRLLEARLSLRIRASQGGFRTITLPQGAELQRVTVDGKERAIRASGRKVNLPLRPGRQNFELRWQQAWERSLVEGMPAVDLGGEAVNVNLTIELGEDRWLLWARGPSWGPAVLFWSHLLVLILLALGLSRVPGTPLRAWHWLLFGIGFAQVPAPVLLIVAFWFFALAWRKSFWATRTGDAHALAFDASQLVLALWTLVAFGCLYRAIHTNLLMDIDMQVAGAGSSNSALSWYVDRVTGELPSASILSLPLLAWRLAMLLWSLWLVRALLKWLPWAWRCFADGGLWRKTAPKPIAGAASFGATVTAAHAPATDDAVTADEPAAVDERRGAAETIMSSAGPIPAPPPRADDADSGADEP